MAKTITQLSVELFGNIAPFANSFGGAAPKIVENFTGSITSAGAKLAAFTGIGAAVGGALAGIGAAFGSALAVKEPFGAIDATAKLSDRLGVTTEALVGLQHAADLSGVSSEELTGGFEKMFKTLGDAMAGGKAAQDTFAALGLNFTELQNESPESAFKQIAQKISEIQNPAQRAAAAMDIFGKSGQSLIPLLAGGAEGLSAAQAEAAKLGLTFSRVDAAKVEEANDAATRLTSSFTGLARTATIALAPLVTFGANGLTAGLTNIIPEINGVAGSISATLGGIYDRVSPYLAAGAASIWQGVQSVWGSIYGYISQIAGGIYDAVATRFSDTVVSITASVMAQWNVISATWGAISNLASWLWEGVVGVWTWATGETLGKTTDLQGGVATATGGIIDSLNWLRDKGTTGLNTLAYFIQHAGEVFDLAGATIDLAVVRIGNQIGYVFQEVLPEIGAWFINNWSSLFTDYFNSQLTQFKNFGKNVVSLFSNLPGLINGSVNLADIWTPLDEGFKATLKDLPRIPERVKGVMETALEQDVSNMQENLGDGLAAYLAEQKAKAEEIGHNIANTLQNALNGPNALKAPEIPNPKPLKTSLDNSKLTVTIEPQLAGAIKAGSAEAQALAFAVRPAFTAPAPASAAPIARTGADGVDALGNGLNDRFRQLIDIAGRTEKNTRPQSLQMAAF